MKQAMILLSALFVATTVTFAAPPRAMDAQFAEIQKELDEIGRLAGESKPAKARKAAKILEEKVRRLLPLGTVIELDKCPVSAGSGGHNGILKCAGNVLFWWNPIPDEMLEQIEDMDTHYLAGTFQIIRSVGPVHLRVTENGELLVPVNFIKPTKAE